MDVLTQLFSSLAGAKFENLFVLAGLAFVALAIVGQLPRDIRVGIVGRVASALLGVILVAAGIRIYVGDQPQGQTPPTHQASGDDDPAPPEYVWVKALGTDGQPLHGDYSPDLNHDTSEGDSPEGSECSSSYENMVAICWPLRPPQSELGLANLWPGPVCAYKLATSETPPLQNDTPGTIYVCTHRQAKP
jgi:hypothetical protein